MLVATVHIRLQVDSGQESRVRSGALWAPKRTGSYRPRLCGKSWGGLLRPTGARGDIVLPLSRHVPGRYAR